MRIAIDAHMIGQRETGNERYTRNLIAGLSRVDADNEYTVLVTDARPLRQAVELPPNFAIRIVRPKANLPRLLWTIPEACRRVGAQVVHVSYTAPPIGPCATVVTVHDTAFARFPSFFSLRDRLLLSVTVPMSCRSAARVIAVSEHTKRDLVERYAISQDKIRVVYEAAERRFASEVPARHVVQVRQRYASGRRYVLAVGNIQPRKNLGLLIEAFAIMVSRGVAHGDTALVIAGQKTWGSSATLRTITKCGLGGRVCLPGFVPDGDLPALYRGAEVFAYPSLYEGFGLPPLESMASGTPVVSSNAGALAEVVGDGGVLVAPYDASRWADAIGRLLEDEGHWREMRDRGFRRVARFSWDDTARKTLSVYRSAAETAGAS